VAANDGTHYEVDAIFYATGFHATEYLFPMDVVGTDGRTINEVWQEGGARAYHGTMVAGFPNLWMVYGPNTNGGLNPAGFHEMVTRYALECMERLITSDDEKAIEVSRDAYDRHNRLVDERNLRKVWSDSRARNYYWTEHGRSAVMCPFFPGEVFNFLRHPDFAELDVR
jgi:4-hydroxyacetophenone monooxygenase